MSSPTGWKLGDRLSGVKLLCLPSRTFAISAIIPDEYFRCPTIHMSAQNKWITALETQGASRASGQPGLRSQCLSYQHETKQVKMNDQLLQSSVHCVPSCLKCFLLALLKWDAHVPVNPSIHVSSVIYRMPSASSSAHCSEGKKIDI